MRSTIPSTPPAAGSASSAPRLGLAPGSAGPTPIGQAPAPARVQSASGVLLAANTIPWRVLVQHSSSQVVPERIAQNQSPASFVQRTRPLQQVPRRDAGLACRTRYQTSRTVQDTPRVSEIFFHRGQTTLGSRSGGWGSPGNARTLWSFNSIVMSSPAVHTGLPRRNISTGSRRLTDC